MPNGGKPRDLKGCRDCIEIEVLTRIADALLETAGESVSLAPDAAREVARALAVSTVAEAYRKERELAARVRHLVQQAKFHQLFADSVKGFSSLSNPDAFLTESALAEKARRTIQEHYAAEPEEVGCRLREKLASMATGEARAARNAFRRYVQYIFLGTPGFGTRDVYLEYGSHQERVKAMQTAIFRMIRTHSRFKDVGTDKFIVETVASQAEKLADTLKGVSE